MYGIIRVPVRVVFSIVVNVREPIRDDISLRAVFAFPEMAVTHPRVPIKLIQRLLAVALEAEFHRPHLKGTSSESSAGVPAATGAATFSLPVLPKSRCAGLYSPTCILLPNESVF